MPTDGVKRKYVQFTQELADDICERLASGESLLGICRSSDRYPHWTAVILWKNTREDFREQYRVAREDQVELWADEIMGIADEHVAPEYIMHSRLRVDTRKWMLSKLKPGTYGDKVQHANAAGDGNQEITHKIYSWADDPDDK